MGGTKNKRWSGEERGTQEDGRRKVGSARGGAGRRLSRAGRRPALSGAALPRGRPGTDARRPLRPSSSFSPAHVNAHERALPPSSDYASTSYLPLSSLLTHAWRAPHLKAPSEPASGPVVPPAPPPDARPSPRSRINRICNGLLQDDPHRLRLPRSFCRRAYIHLGAVRSSSPLRPRVTLL